jgi:nitrate reductase NapD
MNISGILVQTKPEHIKSVIEMIESSDFCEFHLNDEKGRIVVTIEGENAEEEMNKLNQLKRIEHIIAADMVYSYSEDELDELRTNIDNEQKIPDWLNDPEARAENIKYNGDLKKKY